MDEKWNVDAFPAHMQMDAVKRNKNIDDGKYLCKKCEGTGNELYSMYKKCSDCNGSGTLEKQE